MIIAVGQTGSSWYFKWFQRLTVIVVSLAGFLNYYQIKRFFCR